MFEKLQADHQRFRELDAALLDPALAVNPSRYATLAKERGALAKLAVPYERYLEFGREIAQAPPMALAEADFDMRAYAEAEIEALVAKQQEVGESLRDMLYDKAAGSDRAALIMEVRAGVGGDEAALFARDLFEMYRRYAEIKGWRFEGLEVVPTELGGFREVTFGVTGNGAFRHLQFESGTHRVQRVPETETQGRVHTSAATVAVLPEPEDVDIVIRDEDIHFEFMTAGGPGGQHQNKTASAVRMVHLPTNTVVVCRDERSQHKNRAKALRILRGKLFDQKQEKVRSERAEQRRTLVGSGDRSQRIRTYSFPQNRVTDHRINQTWYNLDRIIAGDLDPVATALIDHDRREQLGDLS